MPFGLDLKSIIVGVLFAMFVWPWVIGLLNKNKTPQPAS
jgi:hypothetical protein